MGAVTVPLRRGGLQGGEAECKESTEEKMSVDHERSVKIKNLSGSYRS